MNTTHIDAIADGIYRISTPVPATVIPGGFSFNQYLIVDDEPLIFHTGSRRLYPAVREAIARVMPIDNLRYISFSHNEQDENGALNEFLADSPKSVPVCGTINAMINSDGMDRPPKILADGATLKLGKHVVRWLDAPHVPHGWETGYLFDEYTKTLLCGDLFTQPGIGEQPLTDGDILGPSEALRTSGMDYFAHGRGLKSHLERLASTQPKTLACMHGSAWTGDGAHLLRTLAAALQSP